MSIPVLYVVLVLDNKYFYKDRAAKGAAQEVIAHQSYQTCKAQQLPTIAVAQETRLTRPDSFCVVEPRGMEKIFSGGLARCFAQKKSVCKNFDIQFIESSGPLNACTGSHGHYLRWDVIAGQARATVIDAPTSQYFVRFAGLSDATALGSMKYSVSLESRNAKSPIATTELIMDSTNRGCPQSPEEVVAKMFSLVFSN